MKKKNIPVALILSVAAFVLAGYATYATYDLKKNGHSDDTFKANVFDVIDDYVAEKSGQPTGPVEVSLDE
jgi:hypothetical protein